MRIYNGKPSQIILIPNKENCIISSFVASLLLPDQSGLELQTYQATATTLTFCIEATQSVAKCPVCADLATKIQSRYQRKLADLSWANFRVQLILQVRRFWCLNSECVRKIFCERLPQLTQAYARRTTRLTQRLVDLALFLGGRPAQRLAHKLDLPIGRSTLLRLLDNYTLADYVTPRVLGVDDFALRRGQVYATLLVDLEKHQPIEVLADRTSQTFGNWLKEHPGIEVISRDRDSSYALAATKNAPQAIQVADRFHILKNLRDYLDDFFKRKKIWQHNQIRPEANSQAALPVPALDLAGLAPSSIQLAASTIQKQAEPTKEDQLKTERLANRLERYQQVKTLEQQGLSNRQIARELGLNRNSINRYILAADAQEAVGSKPKQARPSLLDGHKLYLYQRFCEEQPTIAQLHQELQERGYSGSIGPIRAFLAKLRPQPYWSANRTKVRQHLVAEQLPPFSSTSKLSSRQASWLVFKRDQHDELLTTEQRQLLKALREKDPQIELVYQLAQQFREMVNDKRAEDLTAWLIRARASKIKELSSFCNGLERDRAAVEAGLSLKYSNGQLEGQVNKAKNIKRQMFGRAKFKLLRTRILAAA